MRGERVREASASHLLSGGIRERLAADLSAAGASLCVVDGTLSPVQQRNLERELKVKVVDRTGLILEIFGLRARTREGRLQVELARLLYERSRLVRTWTHLERQRGGSGFLAGPGETQLESDRRMLDDEIGRLKLALDEVRRTRRLQRAGRRKRETPVIALVGYTNAGKSTLFNALTGAGVFVRDMPFATLDPTIRAFGLPSGREAALVDTVGFISDLPLHLIESFQATLEEVLDADLLVHVRDRSTPEDFDQRDDVVQVLERLEKTSGRTLPPMIEAWNKSDRLDPAAADSLRTAAPGQGAVLVSAREGSGLEDLIAAIEHALAAGTVLARFRLAPHQGEARAWLYAQTEVLEESVDEAGFANLNVRARPDQTGRFRVRFPDVEVVGDPSVSGEAG